MNLFHLNKKPAALAAGSALLISAAALFYPVDPSMLREPGSLKIVSREGTELRKFRTRSDGSYADHLPLTGYPRFLVRALLTAEDRRFFFHQGPDPRALIRSLYLNVKNRSIVTGGSTITQQLARLIWRHSLPKNPYLRKTAELWLAMRLELSFTKEQILESYMNRVPLKYNSTGFAAAAERIFGRNISFLTEEELTALTVLVRRSETGRDRFDLSFLSLWGHISPHKPARGMDRIREDIFSSGRVPAADQSPATRHFEEWIRTSRPGLSGTLRTGISHNLNDKITGIINSELAFLDRYDVDNAAVCVLAIDHSGYFRLIAMVGSREFASPRAGQVNGALAVREAGSSLKPFIYALAMDTENLLPNSIVEDRQRGFLNEKGEVYMPRNYDLAFWGNITVREALGASRNIPAVDMISRTGVSAFHSWLRDAGLDHLDKPGSYYGYGLALGAGGVNLVQLTSLYAALANGGVLQPVLIGQDESGGLVTTGPGRRIMSEKSSIYIRDILRDKEVRKRAQSGRNFLDFPFDAAVKTGTSKDYRDSWTAGFINGYAVGVWTGNFSGKAMQRVSGSWGAGRIFHQVVRLLAGRDKPRFNIPPGYGTIQLCRNSGRLPGVGCPLYTELLNGSDYPVMRCTGSHNEASAGSAAGEAKITSPARGEIFILDTLKPLSSQAVPLKISCPPSVGNDILYYYQTDSGPRIILTRDLNQALNLKRGSHTVTLFRGSEPIETVEFQVR